MKRILAACLFWLGLISLSVAGVLTAPSAPTNLSAYSTKQVPVCNNAGFPSTVTSGNAVNAIARTVYYCPQGATKIQFVFSGAWAVNGVESSMSDPMPMDLGLETSVPALWNSTTTYPVGATVSWAGTSTTTKNPTWTALASNTNSAPNPSNANWAVKTTSTILQVTCNGIPTCTLQTTTNSSGATVAQGLLITDPITVSVPVGGYIALRTWIAQQNTQNFVDLPGQGYSFGSYLQTNATPTDITQTGTSYVNVNNASGGNLSPVAIIGTPVALKPTVCVLGDSRAIGSDNEALLSPTIVSGGSGYVQADLGTILTVPGTGGTANGVSASQPAQLIITGVNNGSGTGAVTALNVYDVGLYGSPAINPSTTLPTGNQTLTGGTGTGLTVTVTFSTSQREKGDQYGAIGPVDRALSESGIAWAQWVDGGDAAYLWLTRDYTRLATIAATGCSSAIIELGVNDAGIKTPAQMEANLLTLAAQLKSVGVKKVFATTLPPESTSTDGYITTTNQTQSTNQANRVGYNDWLRTNPTGIDGYFELANTVESSQDSGYWGSNGTTLYYTGDGTHSGEIGYAAQAQAIINNIGLLQ